MTADKVNKAVSEAQRFLAAGKEALVRREKPKQLNVNISVVVDMADFANWQPEQIQAFMRGIAEVLSAQGGV